jgi:hypothetical protein
MKLFIAERLLLLEYLPKTGDFAALKEMRRAREALSFTGDELTKFEITNNAEGLVTWNNDGNSYEKDIPLTAWVTSKIQELLRDKNTKKELKERDYSLYEKFIVAYDQV